MDSSTKPGLWFERVFTALGISFPVGVYGVAYLPHALMLLVGPILVGYPNLGGVNALGLVVSVGIDMTILLFGIRYMERRLERLRVYAESELLTGEKVSTKGLYGARGQVGAFLLLIALLGPPLTLNGSLPWPVVLIDLPGWQYFSAYFSTFVWVYAYSMYKIYKLGKSPLKLRPFTEDKTLGLKPFGAASLQFSAVFFVLVLGAFIPSSLLYYTGFPVIALVGLLSAFVLTGTVIFLAPLISLRPHLRRAKAEYSAWVAKQYTELVEQMRMDSHPTREDEMLYSSRLASIDKLQKDIKQIKTWPFDTGVLERFLAIIISVTAITIANVIKLIL